jgi:alkylation response protein AidB-like acyl-CoA dehydrogenase
MEENDMKLKADTTLIEAARHIAPVIQKHKEEAERERRLSRPVLDALYETGLLRMYTPRSLGGLEADPITRALVMEELASHDTAAAWTLFNPLDWAFFCARLPDAGAEEIYSNGANILIAAQFGRPLNAIPFQHGYRLTGRAPFVSNAYDADWIAGTALVMDEDTSQAADQNEPEMIMVYFPREQCEVIDTWNTMGMRGTGSHDILVTDVFVPKTRTFPMVPEFEPGSHYQAPLYRFPLMGVCAASISPIMLAVARQAIDEVAALAQGKTPVAANTLLRERASAQAKLARAEGTLQSGRSWLYDIISEAWEATIAGKAHSLGQYADLLLAMTHAAHSAVQAVELVYSIAGTSGIHMNNPLARYFRDIQVLKQHVLVAESRYETVGQAYLGLPPDFPVLTF